MKFSNLSIRSKLLLGMSLLVLGYIGTIANGFYKGAQREVQFIQIKDVLVPLANQSDNAVYTYENVVKAYDDASMVGDDEMVKEAGKKMATLSQTYQSTNQKAEAFGVLSDKDKALPDRIKALGLKQGDVFRKVSSGAMENSREEVKALTAALTAETQAIRKGLQESAKQRQELLDQNLVQLADQTRWQRKFDLWLGLGIIIVSGVLVYLIIQRGIVDYIDGVVANLRDSAGKLDGATGTIRASSQSLAEGASTQAASLEETSATLEEISGMARRNAENSQTAKDRVGSAQTAASQGLEDVKAMTSAMGEIKTASDNIAKIVKAIDEIAFQTNILALNAAVEAARAGEAGAGFAVVAEEVRNLAQRSAQAARETAQLIEDSITKSERGARMSDKVAASLQQINSQVADVSNLIVEIAQASQEQSSGVSQVNNAVVQLDKLTQSNAATAEESAAAVQELAAQSKELHVCLGDLAMVVYGASHASDAVAHAHEHGHPVHMHMDLGASSTSSRGAAVKTVRASAPVPASHTPSAKPHSAAKPAAAAESKGSGKVIARPEVNSKKADDFFES